MPMTNKQRQTDYRARNGGKNTRLTTEQDRALMALTQRSGGTKQDVLGRLIMKAYQSKVARGEIEVPGDPDCILVFACGGKKIEVYRGLEGSYRSHRRVFKLSAATEAFEHALTQAMLLGTRVRPIYEEAVELAQAYIATNPDAAELFEGLPKRRAKVKP